MPKKKKTQKAHVVRTKILSGVTKHVTQFLGPGDN